MGHLEATLALLRDRITPGEDKKIVCLSLPKTATTSFHHYLEAAGLRVAGSGPTKSLREGTPRQLEAFAEACELRIRNCDGFQEWPWCFYAELFREKYPATKFVVFTRPFEAWYRSYRGHLAERDRSQRVVEQFLGVPPTADESEYRAAYDRHYKTVAKATKGAPALTIALSEDNAQICRKLNEFLGFAVEEFPHMLDHRRRLIFQVRTALRNGGDAETILSEYRALRGDDEFTARAKRMIARGEKFAGDSRQAEDEGLASEA
jgi:hypothetical protein